MSIDSAGAPPAGWLKEGCKIRYGDIPRWLYVKTASHGSTSLSRKTAKFCVVVVVVVGVLFVEYFSEISDSTLYMSLEYLGKRH